MNISIYLVLLIVLLVFNLVFWLLVIWFRILFDCDFGRCCTRRSDDRRDEPVGHRNPGFVDHEDLLRPNTIAALMDSPPSYEEALKYDRFGFPVHTTLSTPLTTPSTATRCDNPPAEENPPSSEETSTHQHQMSESPPSTTRVPIPATRSRSSTASSNACPLSPILEEEFIDDMPVTVIIDCIGVQASRLVPNCDTKVDIAGGESLHEHSAC